MVDLYEVHADLWINRAQIVSVKFAPALWYGETTENRGWRVLVQMSDGKQEIVVGERPTIEEARALRADLLGLEWPAW